MNTPPNMSPMRGSCRSGPSGPALLRSPQESPASGNLSCEFPISESGGEGTSTPESRPVRNKDQSMGIWINEPMLRSPESIDREIATLADSGYGIIRLFLRNSTFNHRSPEVIAVIERAVKKAHLCGVRAVLDCEPHLIVGNDMGRAFPDDMGSLLIKVAAWVCDGHWTLRVDTPKSVGTSPVYDGIEAAFLTVDGVTRRVDPAFRVSCEMDYYENGDIHRELHYSEEVPVSPRKTIELRGELPGICEGTLVAYVRFRSHTLPDFWSAGFRRYYEDLLDCYRHIPLDGVAWDEPAVDGNWSRYRYGGAFADAFERLNGYRLSDRLHLLDSEEMSGEAVRVRLDYYRTLNEGIARAQARLNSKARELFGSHLISGTHHTWQGEGGINDYRAGAVDYFRLNDNMDAGYSDCCWWDQPSVAYAYQLASSLGRLTSSGEAEVNTWHFKPTAANVRSNVNLMSLMNINWFNIWFGSDTDTAMQAGHYTWPGTVESMRSHRKLQLALGQKRPVVDVAVWHGWEGVCGWNRPGLANAHKAFCINISQLFIARSLAMDFLDSRLLEASRVEGGRLINRLGAYRVLVVPYALVMPRAAFQMCLSFVKGGGRLVFVGTPVAFDEAGNSQSPDFAGIFHMPEMSAEHYMRGFDCTLPAFRPQRLEVCRQLSSDLPNKLVSSEGEIHGLKTGEAVFLTDLDPQERLVDQITDALMPTVKGYGDNLLWRLFRDGGGEALVVVSSDARPLEGIIVWDGVAMEILGGSAGIFSRNSSAAPSMEGDLSWRIFRL